MDWQGWVNSTALGLLVSVLIEQIQYFQLHILHPLWLVRVLAIHSPYKMGLFHGPVRSKVRSSVARDWEDGKCPLEEDECVSEVLHPLRSSKIHACRVNSMWWTVLSSKIFSRHFTQQLLFYLPPWQPIATPSYYNFGELLSINNNYKLHGSTERMEWWRHIMDYDMLRFPAITIQGCQSETCSGSNTPA